MGAKFKYPGRPNSVTEEDWKALPAQTKVAPAGSLTSPEKSKKTDSAKGFVRLVDFIKTQLKEKARKLDPELQKRQKIISAYKKTKSA